MGCSWSSWAIHTYVSDRQLNLHVEIVYRHTSLAKVFFFVCRRVLTGRMHAWHERLVEDTARKATAKGLNCGIGQRAKSGVAVWETPTQGLGSDHPVEIAGVHRLPPAPLLTSQSLILFNRPASTKQRKA